MLVQQLVPVYYMICFTHDWRTTKFDEGSHAYVHPRIAAKNAEKITELSDLERDIIIKHMWVQLLHHQNTKKVTL